MQILERHPKANHPRAVGHLGTLGTGNHFVELCIDEENRLWVMLHSGSRGVGNRLGTYFIELAKKEMRRWFINLPDEDLAYLPEGTEHFDAYVRAVIWAQRYARANREVMIQAVLDILRASFPNFATEEVAVNCHHNYVAKKRHFGKNVWLTRKGAVRAGAGDLGIVPGSMGRNPSSFAARAIRTRSRPAPTEPAARCRAMRRSVASPSRTMHGRPLTSNAARMPTSSMRRRAPTRTSTL
ncbi:MAG TPA: RtcB family protein [Stellaceae bacterium]|nr:RtcB family protein [Stellaceae bacterium]